MNIEKFQKRINKKYPKENLQVLNYDQMKKPVTIKCLKCDSEFSIQGQNYFLKAKKRVCNKCFPNRRNELEKSKKNFIKWYKEKGIQHFTIESHSITNLKSSKDLIVGKCKVCGRNNKKTIYDYMRGRGCGCTHIVKGLSGRKKTPEEFLSQVPKDYLLLDSYTGAHTKVTLKHECGFIWKITPHNFLSGKGCPICNRKVSKGEKKVAEILKRKKVLFNREHPILIDGKRLRLDFYIEKDKIGIEFNGRQHYEPVDFFGGESQFEKQKENDKLKSLYCENNGITLIIIHHKDMDNIEEILNQYL